jgi:hypothetical protein
MQYLLFSKYTRIAGFPMLPFQRASQRRKRDPPTRAAASVIGVTAPNNALAYEASG